MKYLKTVSVTAGFASICLGGAAWVAASIPDSSTGVISACVKSNGQITIIDAENGQQCKNNESPLNWNQSAAGGGGATIAIIPSLDETRIACTPDWGFTGDNCGSSEELAAATAVHVDTADYPATTTFSFELGTINWSILLSAEVCVRLWNVTTHEPVAGSETCTTIPAGATYSNQGQTRVVSAGFTLPTGSHEYVMQARQLDAVLVESGDYYENLAGVRPFQLVADW